MDKSLIAKQINVAMQKFVQNMNLTEEEAMEIADLYPSWESKLHLKQKCNVGEIIKYGVNQDNETQLYSVIQEHNPQEDWTPDKTESLYKKIGFTESGISLWVQPLGSIDAYMKNDEVSYNEKIWISEIDNNVWQPGVYGWKLKK